MVNLSLLMPEFEDKIKEFVLDAQYSGMDVDVQSAFRSIDEQNHLYSLGRTMVNQDGMSPQKPLGNIVTNAKAGHSWHNWGVAADIVFRQDGNWSWNVPDKAWFNLALIAKKYGLQWGGAWMESQNKSLGDLDHFELTGGMPIEMALNIGNITNVWEEVRRRING